MFDRKSFEATQFETFGDIAEEIESFATDSEIVVPPAIAFSARTNLRQRTYSFHCKLVNPYVQLVSEFLPQFERKDISRNEHRITSTQVRQASEIYQELIRQKVLPKEALEMLGPLASEVRKYRISFSFREVRTGVPIGNGDKAFMSLPWGIGTRWCRTNARTSNLWSRETRSIRSVRAFYRAFGSLRRVLHWLEEKQSTRKSVLSS